MSKKASKVQASSSRAVSSVFGGTQDGSGFGSGFGGVPSSPLSFVYNPPDLSGLSNPNVGVAFKNLQKKDSTTKAKALEDLQTFVTATADGKNELEEPLLEVWIKVYPRTSIDSSRRVRQLAHILQGQIALSCGKRIAKYMPDIVPAWLAGIYDNDKSVSRAAQESFRQVFSTEVKYKSVWRVYQAAIIEFASDVILKETGNTLSDERTTSPDDASAKYSRTVGAVIATIIGLLENTSEADLNKSHESIASLLSEGKLWKLASHTDPFVRRAVHRLLVIALAKQKESLAPTVISTNILTAGLHTSQTGSAYEYVKALVRLTTEVPDVWTHSYSGTGKKSATIRLCQFLRKGSQGGPADFWKFVERLLLILPKEILIGVSSDGSNPALQQGVQGDFSVIEALHDGVASKDEPRANSHAGWDAYLSTCNVISSSSMENTDRNTFLRAHVLPLLAQYVEPTQNQSKWTVAGQQQEEIILKACQQVLDIDFEGFATQWRALSSSIVEDMKRSSSEQSRMHHKSHGAIEAKISKWYRLKAALFAGSSTSALQHLIHETATSEIQTAMLTLKTRNGEPYEAAVLLELAVQTLAELIMTDVNCQNQLQSFANNDLPDMLFSPSTTHLFRLLTLLNKQVDVRQSYSDSMKMLAEAPESPAKTTAITAFLSSPCLENTSLLAQMATHVLDHAMQQDDTASWNAIAATISNPTLPKPTTEDILAKMIGGLSMEEQKRTGLHGLELTAEANGLALKEYALSPAGSALLSTLLLLADDEDEIISQRAKSLNNVIEGLLSSADETNQAVRSLSAIIQRNFNHLGSDSLSLESLSNLATKVMSQTSEADLPLAIAEILPSSQQWREALESFINRLPSPGLAITNSFGGAISLVNSSSEEEQIIPRDSDGLSSLFRLFRYTTQLIKTTENFTIANAEQKTTIVKNLAVISQLAGDDLSVLGNKPLWISLDVDLEQDIVECVADSQSLLASWIHISPTPSYCIDAQARLLEESVGPSSSSYYNGRAYSALTSELTESYGYVPSDQEAEHIKTLRKSEHIFLGAALLTSSESKDVTRLANDLLADLTGQDLVKDEANGLRKIVLLNCILQTKDDYVTDIPQQRLVFFVKHMVSELMNPSLTSVIQAEIMKALRIALVPIKEIYGSFWADIFTVLQQDLAGTVTEARLTNIHASLRLLSLLRKPQMQEANDDLLDAWTDQKHAISKSLIMLMVQHSAISDEFHQPRRIINELLGRQIIALSQDVVSEVETLFPVLASDSSALQEAAYKLLHDYIPSVQEEQSVEKALSKEYRGTLPEELLSLILAPPPMSVLAEARFDRTVPSSLRSYLLSWKLIFDHWTHASYNLQADYVESLKEGTYAKELLDLISKVLIISRNKPVDATKYDIEVYSPDIEPPEKDTHWILINLYYLCLRHLPSLTKTWWRDTTTRQTNIAVEAWTEKYLSRTIIASELSTIKDWAPEQATGDTPLTIKTSIATRQIIASTPIDEQSMAISITLPPSYPLARAEVSGVHRVGIAQNKWDSWIRNAQGQLTTASGGAGEGNALIDCLMAWRKNVEAALKNQTECAICYSMVAADRTLPKQQCKTCKNRFHASCLFRWFKSSASSSCPLCRNSFQYA